MGLIDFFRKKDKVVRDSKSDNINEEFKNNEGNSNDSSECRKVDLADSKISRGFLSIFSRSKLGDNIFEEVEELLIEADVGVYTTEKILSKVKKDRSALKDINTFKSAIKESIFSIINREMPKQDINQKPFLTLVVGVNGVGKTTTIAKLASTFQLMGKKPLLVAGDTFRAGAVDQLSIWADRLGIPIVKSEGSSDPAAVVYDGLTFAKNNDIDIVLVDTAGRLQNKQNLMNELAKIEKVANKIISTGFNERLLILDATTGQNVVSQAREFNQLIGITGIILTKLDGTAKGGTIIRIIDELSIPVLFIGTGEKISDIEEFNARNFVESILK